MTSDKQRLIIEVARLYYQLDYTQQDIAKKLGVSRPTVSRLLQQAKELGYVKIEIIDPLTNIDELSKALKAKYHLDAVKIGYAAHDEEQELKQAMSEMAAEYLHQVVKDGDILGVTWGTTMHRVALQLSHKNVKGVEVIQLKGGVGHSHVNTYVSETVYLFAEAFNTIPRYLPLPVIVDNPMVKEVIESDRHIHRLIELGKQANIAVFTVGTVKENALLFRLGYLSADEKSLIQSKAVGDICSRFFTRDGDICSASINERTIGIELEELKQKEKSILVAGGKRKIEAIHGALLGGYANVFITDQYTAQSLLMQE